jgi:hypothetical protein
MFSSFGIVGFASNDGRKSGKYYVICHKDAGVIMSNLYLIYPACTLYNVKDKAPSVHRGASTFLSFLNFVM